MIVLREKTYIYDANTLAILDTIDTVPNLKGKIRIRAIVVIEAFKYLFSWNFVMHISD